MSKRHVISLDGVTLPLVHKHELAGAYGDGEHKSLMVVVTVHADGRSHVQFEVHNRSQLHGVARTLSAAVEMYNEI